MCWKDSPRWSCTWGLWRDIVAGGLERLNRLSELARPLVAQAELVEQRRVARFSGGAGGINFQLDLVGLRRHSLGQLGGLSRLLLLGPPVGDVDLLMDPLKLHLFQPLADVQVAAAGDGQQPESRICSASRSRCCDMKSFASSR